MHIFKQHHKEYIDKGISVIPDKYQSKQAGVKGFSKYSEELPSKQDLLSWCNNLTSSNIAIMLGEASGIVALDVDTEDQAILQEILPILPKSPVEKVGAKGFTRFFRYTGEPTQLVKFNGEVVLEILSTNKKTTMPPSVHPSGVSYKWTTNKTLLDIDIKDLPLLPPFLVTSVEQHLRTKFPDLVSDGKGKMVSGRNNELSHYCGTLIREKVSIDEAIKRLIEKDRENEIALFSDPEEMPHTSAYTNALCFYSNHLSSVNSKHYRRKEEYEEPLLASAINDAHLEIVNKARENKSGKKKLKEDRVCTCPFCKKDFSI